jgi:hypothetical protein
VSTTYVGHRNDGTGAVDVYGPEGIEPLQNRWDDGGEVFGWGRDLRASVALARALLSDVYGVAASDELAEGFAADVVMRFPRAGFAVEAEQIRAWGRPRAARRLTPDALVELLGSIAVADEDDEARLRHQIVDSCWDEHTFRH